MHPARHFFSFSKKKGSSVRDIQWVLVCLGFFSSFFWESDGNLQHAVWSQNFFYTFWDWRGTCYVSLRVQEKKWEFSTKNFWLWSKHLLFRKKKLRNPSSCTDEDATINTLCIAIPSGLWPRNFCVCLLLSIWQPCYHSTQASPCIYLTTFLSYRFLLSGLHTW